MEHVGDQAPSEGLTREIVALLAEGRHAVLPTETVYGLAARADSAPALESLAERKGRPASMPCTWHIGSLSALERFERVSPMVRRLADRYWPGPLTLVLPGIPAGLDLVAENGWTGVRLPAHQATQALLEACDFPVVMTSANAHGQAPALNAESARELLNDPELRIVDGGPCRMAESSTVARVGPGDFSILREGPIDLAAMRRCAGLQIAFCCTGNTCRSPMAEQLAAKKIAERLEVGIDKIGEFGFDVRSMGAFAGPGMAASDHSVEAMRREGLDLSEHRSTPLNDDSTAGLDRLYGLTSSHVQAAKDLAPNLQVELLDPDGTDVPDPIGGSLDDYLACATRIDELIDKRLDEWL